MSSPRELGRSWEIIFINDGSTDASAEILDSLADQDRRIRVIYGQNDPADIPRKLEVLDQRFDVVSGWRKDRQDDVIQRKFPSILANRLISAVSGVRLHDFGCSLKAYKRPVVDGIRLYGEMHRFLPIYAP